MLSPSQKSHVNKNARKCFFPDSIFLFYTRCNFAPAFFVPRYHDIEFTNLHSTSPIISHERVESGLMSDPSQVQERLQKLEAQNKDGNDLSLLEVVDLPRFIYIYIIIYIIIMILYIYIYGQHPHQDLPISFLN